MDALTKLALALVIIGGLNWLLVGLFQVDLVAAIFGVGSIGSRAVYVIVGISALICLKLFAYRTASDRRPHGAARAA